MSSPSPIVAVLVGRHPEERYSLHRGYVDALAAVGARPLVVPAGPGLEQIGLDGWLDGCQGVVVTGGGDVAPARYGQVPSTDTLDAVDDGRDAVEIAAVRWAIERELPVLGICRGHQVLAVALGGTLIQDLPSAGHDGHWALDREYLPAHGLKVEAGSMAEAALGGATEVNSIHHQAVADPGPQLRCTAWSPDGVIEAVEAVGLLGLQWHPERLSGGDPRHLAPFRWLVDGCPPAGHRTAH